MSSALLGSCWNALRLLAKAVKTCSEPIAFCSMSLGTRETVKLNAMLADHDDGNVPLTLIIDANSPRLPADIIHQGACFTLRGLTHMSELTPGALPAPVKQMISVYAPYCFTSLYAKHWQRSFAISHFAQSLDGRIATASGYSQGIGGAENLAHAHRMRALCDGILIGAGTLRRDQPRLTVRHVPGCNPTRIVVGSSLAHTDSLIQASPDPVLLLSTQNQPLRSGIEVLTLHSDNTHLSSLQILEALYQQGIHSVYIEGGPMTTSHFLQEGYLDVVQLHTSPMIMGSGESVFTLPEIERIPESLRFVSHTYVPVGDGMMFIGALRHPTL